MFLAGPVPWSMASDGTAWTSGMSVRVPACPVDVNAMAYQELGHATACFRSPVLRSCLAECFFFTHHLTLALIYQVVWSG